MAQLERGPTYINDMSRLNLVKCNDIMAFPCSHTVWLRFKQNDDGGKSILCNDRLRMISNFIPRPSQQRPSCIFFIGKEGKTRALNRLYPKILNKAHFGIANISLDPTTETNDYPLLIADHQPLISKNRRQMKETCHRTKSYSLHLEYEKAKIMLFPRVFSLLIDVLCIFADDIGGLRGVSVFLQEWLTSPDALGKPEIVVVVSKRDEMGDAIFMEIIENCAFKQCFSGLTVVQLPPTKPLFVKKISSLKETLSRKIDQRRADKKCGRALFTMEHIAYLFRQALESFCRSPSTAFDCIVGARADFPATPELEEHLRAFVGLEALDNILRNSYVASCLLLDAYPPNMHLFDPDLVFRTLYRQPCERVLQPKTVDDVRSEFNRQFALLEGNKMTSSDNRRAVARLHNGNMHKLSLPSGCLSCLQRTAEHHLQCGHGICSTCVQIFGYPSCEKEYQYVFRACPVCSLKVEVTCQIIPPTAGMRILSIDGGGCRGVVSIAFLQKIEKEMGPYSIQDNIDFAIGTSSGGLLVLGLFAKNWSPEKCYEFFCKFAEVVFPRKSRSLCSWFRSGFRAYFGDGRYNSDRLEEIFQQALGSGYMLEATKLSGKKYGVLVTTTDVAKLFIATNYHGGPGGVPHLPCGNISLWEAARMTSAAITFFKPYKLKMGALGTFQDGGLKNNNPVRPGLMAIKQHPSARPNERYDLVLSVGTGFEKKASSPIASNIRNVFVDGPIPRLIRASMHSLSLNAENSWLDHDGLLTKDGRDRNLRLNLPLTEREPALDDAGCMTSLYQQAQDYPVDVVNVVRGLAAASFFFEMHKITDLGSLYEWEGSILSRSTNVTGVLEWLARTHPSTVFVNGTEELGFVSADDICQTCDIRLKFSQHLSRSISGCPRTVNEFANIQNLFSPFGQPNHRTGVDSASCFCRRLKSKKRKVDSSEMTGDEHIRKRRQLTVF